MLTRAMFEGQIDPEIASDLVILNSVKNPILSTAFLAPNRMSQTGDEEFKWYKQGLPSKRSQINNGGAAYTGATTSIVVDAGAVFPAGSLIYAEATGEVLYVSARAGNTLTVVRGVGGTTGAAGSVADDAFLTHIGMASGEGATAFAAVHESALLQRNYVQTFRKSVEVTGRAQAMRNKTPADQRAYQRQIKFEEFLDDHERALIFGVASQSDIVDAAGKKVTTTGGFLENIVTNVDNVAGTLSRNRLNQFAEKAFAYGSGEKLAYCGNTVVETLHELWKDRVEVEPTTPEVGLRIERYRTAYGTLRVIPHRGFRAALAGTMLVIDPNDPQLELRFTNTNGRDGRPNLREDIQNKKDDTMMDEWFSELGLQWGVEENHAVMKGVTGAAS